jgi:uncharacterized damage-inducible protein DinB
MIAQMLLPEFDQEMQSTRKLLAVVPDDKMDYQPHPKSMTLGRLAGHVAEMPTWAKHTMEVELLQLEPGQKPYIATSRQELLDTFDKNVAEARGLISKATDEDFGKTWTLKFGDRQIMSMPRTGVMRTVVMNHLIHHRAQLGVFLRLLDVKIPGMYGPSADDAKF